LLNTSLNNQFTGICLHKGFGEPEVHLRFKLENMKGFKISVTAIALFALLTACNSEKDIVNNEGTAELVQDTVTTEKPELKTITVTGIVQQLNRGKDGYTAELKDANDSIFFATISHSNLNDAAQYKDSKPGDTLNVTGEPFILEGHTNIVVRELK
jgi:hypothetical protein